MPQVPGAAGAAGPAAAISQFLAALGSPTVHQALSSMTLGPAGSPTVPSATAGQLPIAAITNLLGMLASRASAEWEALMPTAEDVGLAEGIDLASPDVHSAWVLAQLAPPELPEGEGESSGDEGWVDELYDELEAEFFSESEAYEGYDGEAWPEPESWSFAAYG